MEEHTAVLFRLVHQTPFNTGVQALMLLLQVIVLDLVVHGTNFASLKVMTANSAVSSRFYCALYAQVPTFILAPLTCSPAIIAAAAR